MRCKYWILKSISGFLRVSNFNATSDWIRHEHLNWSTNMSHCCEWNPFWFLKWDATQDLISNIQLFTSFRFAFTQFGAWNMYQIWLWPSPSTSRHSHLRSALIILIVGSCMTNETPCRILSFSLCLRACRMRLPFHLNRNSNSDHELFPIPIANTNGIRFRTERVVTNTTRRGQWTKQIEMTNHDRKYRLHSLSPCDASSVR